jgi:fatty acyl-CoA reductase
MNLDHNTTDHSLATNTIIYICCFIFKVIESEIFQVLKEKHGVGFNSFIEEKICPMVGDIMYENFGLDVCKLKELSKDIDIIVNGAATTNFFERFEVLPSSRILT